MAGKSSCPVVRDTLQLPTTIVLEIVELYFDLIHDQFHTLFHRPTFTETVAKGTALPVILYAMIALSARYALSHSLDSTTADYSSFSTHLAFKDHCYWDRGSEFAKESARLLDIKDVSLSTIQACILLGTVSRSEGDAAAESVYYSIASRMANLLDLANMPASNAVEREINIRGKFNLHKHKILTD